LPPSDASTTESSLLVQPSSFSTTALFLNGISTDTSVAAPGFETAAPANTFQTAVVQSDQPVLVLFNGVPNQTVDASSGLVSFTIPADAFAQSSSGAGIQLAASQADGQPLPSWLKFNAATGQFVGEPPAGLEGTISIKVLAKNAAGQEVSSVFRIDLGSKTKAQSPAQTEKVTPEKTPPKPNAALGEGMGDGTGTGNGKPDLNRSTLADGKPANTGRSSLSEQIRLASRQPVPDSRLDGRTSPSRRTA
jgi:hypothetical protein